jgi:hypothetical protein
MNKFKCICSVFVYKIYVINNIHIASVKQFVIHFNGKYTNVLFWEKMFFFLNQDSIG